MVKALRLASAFGQSATRANVLDTETTAIANVSSVCDNRVLFSSMCSFFNLQNEDIALVVYSADESACLGNE